MHVLSSQNDTNDELLKAWSASNRDEPVITSYMIPYNVPLYRCLQVAQVAEVVQELQAPWVSQVVTVSKVAQGSKVVKEPQVGKKVRSI